MGGSKAPAESRLSVTGCQHDTVSVIVIGDYTSVSENHGKSVYKRNTQHNGLDVMLYFWDDKKDPKFSGWWFGPKVGGEQIWAFHGNKDSATPPATGWRIPFDGPVDDGFKVSMNTTPLSKEDQRKQQAVENSRKINKELEKNREALNKARKEDEDKREKKKVEQTAALAIRKVVTKLRHATPDNFEALKKELDEVSKQELEKTGSQNERVSQEMCEALEQGTKKVEEEQKRRDAIEELARKKKEEEEAKKRLIEENRRRIEELNR